ncbi:MAG: ABC transporter ATP-binding protein [Deltaproteobacteria bacterium]|nr:ABC transporter ATP-binding protein [Deltaproteobacteria bacterium]
MAVHLAMTDLENNFSEASDSPLPRLAVRGFSLMLDNRVVLDDLYFEVAKGEVLGILGPNGCGKSTLLKCMTGLWKPDRGTLWLDGAALDDTARKLRAVMGVVFQEPSLDNELSAAGNLKLAGALFGLTSSETTQRIEDLLGFMELSGRAKDKTSTFSGGMRRRLELARSLIHNPEILLLDEPTAGLDPVSVQRTWQRILALRDFRDLSVLVTTHRAEEAASCDRLVVMDRGHVICTETPDRLMSNVAGDVISMNVDEPEAMLEGLKSVFGANARIVDGAVEWERPEAHAWVPRIVESFETRIFNSITVRKPTLADAFYHLTGHGLTAEDEL